MPPRWRFSFDVDGVQVSDNGHGVTESDFVTRWMRIGSTHKVRERSSPEFERPLTGSKGVGRLAAQFLAREMRLSSLPKSVNGGRAEGFSASVDWEDAAQAGELTSATALYEPGLSEEEARKILEVASKLGLPEPWLAPGGGRVGIEWSAEGVSLYVDIDTPDDNAYLFTKGDQDIEEGLTEDNL